MSKRLCQVKVSNLHIYLCMWHTKIHHHTDIRAFELQPTVHRSVKQTGTTSLNFAERPGIWRPRWYSIANKQTPCDYWKMLLRRSLCFCGNFTFRSLANNFKGIVILLLYPLLLYICVWTSIDCMVFWKRHLTSTRLTISCVNEFLDGAAFNCFCIYFPALQPI